ncbi:hypothetical protein AcW1_004028 [Taiwanofungus camphoratus]|nr:hypothetical protein AcW1_004028 [Antrodia cinnamomea]
MSSQNHPLSQDQPPPLKEANDLKLNTSVDAGRFSNDNPLPTPPPSAGIPFTCHRIRTPPTNPHPSPGRYIDGQNSRPSSRLGSRPVSRLGTPNASNQHNGQNARYHESLVQKNPSPAPDPQMQAYSQDHRNTVQTYPVPMAQVQRSQAIAHLPPVQGQPYIFYTGSFRNEKSEAQHLHQQWPTAPAQAHPQDVRPPPYAYQVPPARMMHGRVPGIAVPVATNISGLPTPVSVYSSPVATAVPTQARPQPQTQSQRQPPSQSHLQSQPHLQPHPRPQSQPHSQARAQPAHAKPDNQPQHVTFNPGTWSPHAMAHAAFEAFHAYVHNAACTAETQLANDLDRLKTEVYNREVQLVRHLGGKLADRDRDVERLQRELAEKDKKLASVRDELARDRAQVRESFGKLQLGTHTLREECRKLREERIIVKEDNIYLREMIGKLIEANSRGDGAQDKPKDGDHNGSAVIAGIMSQARQEYERRQNIEQELAFLKNTIKQMTPCDAPDISPPAADVPPVESRAAESRMLSGEYKESQGATPAHNAASEAPDRNRFSAIGIPHIIDLTEEVQAPSQLPCCPPTPSSPTSNTPNKAENIVTDKKRERSPSPTEPMGHPSKRRRTSEPLESHSDNSTVRHGQTSENLPLTQIAAFSPPVTEDLSPPNASDRLMEDDEDPDQTLVDIGDLQIPDEDSQSQFDPEPGEIKPSLTLQDDEADVKDASVSSQGGSVPMKTEDLDMQEEKQDIVSSRKHLSISHMPLIYEPVQDRLICRMCRERKEKVDRKLPVVSFPSNASWTDLAGHCEKEHPMGYEKLISMTSKQITEAKLKRR